MSIENDLQELIERKLIKQEKIRDDQIIKLLNRAGKDLKTAQAILNSEIDEEAVFNYAYLAMLRAGRALMFTFGYRPIDGFQHWTVGEFAKKVLGPTAKNIVDQFDEMRRARNQFTYDPDIPVSEIEAKDSINFAKEFIKFATVKIINIKPDLKIN